MQVLVSHLGILMESLSGDSVSCKVPRKSCSFIVAHQCLYREDKFAILLMAEDTRCEQSTKSEDDLSANVSEISVDVTNLDGTLPVKRKHPRKGKRKPKLPFKCQFKGTTECFYINKKIIFFTLMVFVIMLITWTLLWVYVLRTQNNTALYFAGLFRIANIEFIPEYRRKDSPEFLSMAAKVQQVMNNVYKKSLFSKLYKQSTVSDLSNNNNGGILVHFWIVFIVPNMKTLFVSEDCVSAILKDSIQTTGLRSDYIATAVTGSKYVIDKFAEQAGIPIPLNIFAASGQVHYHFKLTSPPGHVIRLSLSSLQIEPDSCVTDSLSIYDSLMPIRSKNLYRVCEPFASFPVSFVSTGNGMFLSFKSLRVHGIREINGYFEAIPSEKFESTIISTDGTRLEGNITSPYYPSYYPLKCSCTWTFKASTPSFGLALKFHNYTVKEKGLERYCGYQIDHQTVFHIANFLVNIMFQCSGKQSDKAFLAEYSSYNISQRKDLFIREH
ncbi:hypothetical protein chiPu_0002812 [Chiloscyllium punctatum]|uniref:CUB domain-containing protein n=1 Tax=Chiloscyllium punctatum TaxID=137246 RepID=A0A401S1X3_CHIPU|nr:hypothetical protein [Chiloscyllium punctatum]